MSEHEQHHKIVLEETNGPVTEIRPRAFVGGARLIAGSIVLAAIIIAAGNLYNTHLTLKSQLATAQQLMANQQQAQAAQGTAQQAAPAQPAGPVTITGRSDEPTLGNKNAKVTIVEFGDFQCPFCKQFFQQSFGQIKSQYIDTGKVQYIFRDFPLTSIHVNAQIAAEAAECANQQGKFWDYHDLLYTDGQSDGTNLDKASLEKYADQLGLNSGGLLGIGKNKFNQCLESNATLKTVQADQAEGTKDGVTGTPTFYINGVQIVGAQPFAQFQTAIDNALKQ